MPDPIDVVVTEVPFDPFTSILIPVAAVLVSALVAIWIAGFERRASRKDRRDAALAEVMAALSILESAPAEGARRREVSRRLSAVYAAVNVAYRLFPTADYPVWNLLMGALTEAEVRGTFRLARAAYWCMSLLVAWQTKQVSIAAIEEESKKVRVPTKAFELNGWQEIAHPIRKRVSRRARRSGRKTSTESEVERPLVPEP